jgi:mannose-1-phosphate guanylyltransferase
MKPNFYPVILAGGRGTRFWPLSRKHRAKQLLALDDHRRTMIQQTVERLSPIADRKNFWIITNGNLREPILKQLPRLERAQIIAEPAGRNTAPAIGLAAFILLRSDPDAVLGLFPADHVISQEPRFRSAVQQAIRIAREGDNIVVMGIPPTRAETGYGYIEVGAKDPKGRVQVRRFTEKPDAVHAQKFFTAGNYFWNSGMFVWSAGTLAGALREHLPATAEILEKIAAAWGTRKFESTLERLYPRCENVSVDYALAEPRSSKGEGRSGLFCIPAKYGWNDLGSWTALHEHKSSQLKARDVIDAADSLLINAEGNYVHAPGKFVALVGVQNVVVVVTDDALLITTREHSQDVGKVVKYLDQNKRHKLT